MRPSIKYVLVGVICAMTAWMGSGFVASANPNDQPVTATAAKKKPPQAKQAKGYSCAEGLALKTMKGIDGTVAGSVKFFHLHNELLRTDPVTKAATLRASITFRNPKDPQVKICKLVVVVRNGSNNDIVKTITAKPGQLHQDYVVATDGPPLGGQVNVYWRHAS